MTTSYLARTENFGDLFMADVAVVGLPQDTCAPACSPRAEPNLSQTQSEQTVSIPS